MEYRCKVTVLDKKLFPELQAQYCAIPDSGKCPCYNVGDEFIFYGQTDFAMSTFPEVAGLDLRIAANRMTEMF